MYTKWTFTAANNVHVLRCYLIAVMSRTRSKLLSWTMLGWGNFNKQKQETSTLTRNMLHWNIPPNYLKKWRFFRWLRFPFHQTFPPKKGGKTPAMSFSLALPLPPFRRRFALGSHHPPGYPNEQTWVSEATKFEVTKCFGSGVQKKNIARHPWSYILRW